MNRIVLVTLLVSAVGSGGCATMTHLTKDKPLPKSTEPGATILIDAKQRAITNATVDGKLRVCAEPSPDALSALAASSGLSLSKAEVAQLAGNFSLAEGAGSIGLRTQSIQLMRDAMYRVCEGYVSGAIDPLAFETLQRRFQSSMVAILAIEQLTGAVRAPTVVLGGNATQGDAERAADLTEKTETARAGLRTAEKTLAEKEAESAKSVAAREALETEEAELKKVEKPNEKQEARLKELAGLITKAKDAEAAAKTGVADATKAKEDKESSLKALDAARLAALAGGGTASVRVEVVSPNDGAENAAGTAAAVQAIVDSTLNLEFGREICATVLTKLDKSDKAPFPTCLLYLGETVNAVKGRTAALAHVTPMIAAAIEATTAVISDPKADASKVKAATDALTAIQKLVTSLSASSGGSGPLFLPMAR